MTIDLQLEDMQGNILQGYGHRFGAYLNLRVSDAGAGRRLLADLLPELTNACRWENDDKPQWMLNLALSYAGLTQLDVPDRVLRTFPDEFRQGMAERAEQLGDVGDSAPDRWQHDLRAGDIHVMAIIHAVSETVRDEQVERLRERVDGCRGVSEGALELGSVGDTPQHTREHFGFADGFGQPAVDGQTGEEFKGQGVPVGGQKRFLRRRAPLRWRMLAAGEFVLGYRDEDGVIPAAPDPPYGPNGTFMVFRKLAQNVVGFRALLAKLAADHFSGDEDLAAAKLVGRWRDGTPVMLSPHRGDPELAGNKCRTNDFRYEKDEAGFTCPIGAHIRRANPRDSLYGGGERTRRHRIIRRGMPYGEPLPEGTEGGDRGLLFVCFNASTARQFEVVNRWLGEGTAFGLAHGDPLSERSGTSRVTIEGDPPVRFECDHGPLITTRGGEYLFVPGLRALGAIAGGEAGP